MTAPRKSPQPPLLFLGCLLAGWVLGLLRPVETRLPARPRLLLGAALTLLAAGLGTWGLRTFRKRGTTHEPNGVATALLTEGPYRFTRNPLYLALATLHAGLGLLLDSVWVLLFTPLLLLLLDRLVIAREEVRLRALFGEDYLAFRRRVRRWL